MLRLQLAMRRGRPIRPARRAAGCRMPRNSRPPLLRDVQRGTLAVLHRRGLRQSSPCAGLVPSEGAQNSRSYSNVCDSCHNYAIPEAPSGARIGPAGRETIADRVGPSLGERRSTGDLTVVANAIRNNHDDPGAFASALSPHAARFALRKGDGIALFQWLLHLVPEPETRGWIDEANAQAERESEHASNEEKPLASAVTRHGARWPGSAHMLARLPFVALAAIRACATGAFGGPDILLRGSRRPEASYKNIAGDIAGTPPGHENPVGKPDAVPSRLRLASGRSRVRKAF